MDVNVQNVRKIRDKEHDWDGSKCQKCGKIKPLMSLSSSVIILGGPGPESEKKMTYNSLHIKSPMTSIFICTTSSDFQQKTASYEKSNNINFTLFYSLNSHPKGKQGMIQWIEGSFAISVNNAVKNIKKTSKLDMDAHVFGDGSGTIQFNLDNITLEKVIEYFSAIDIAYKNSSWD